MVLIQQNNSIDRRDVSFMCKANQRSAEVLIQFDLLLSISMILPVPNPA